MHQCGTYTRSDCTSPVVMTGEDRRLRKEERPPLSFPFLSSPYRVPLAESFYFQFSSDRNGYHAPQINCERDSKR